MMIRLEEITPDNWRLGLRVKEEQRQFVAEAVGILARAWAYRESRSQAFVVYHEDTPVGMALYYDVDEEQEYNFSQFFIDRRYQGQGFGYEASRQIIQRMKEDGKYDKVILCYIEGDEAARSLYEKLGFQHTGEVYDDEVIMVLNLR